MYGARVWFETGSVGRDLVIAFRHGSKREFAIQIAGCLGGLRAGAGPQTELRTGDRPVLRIGDPSREPGVGCPERQRDGDYPDRESRELLQFIRAFSWCYDFQFRDTSRNTLSPEYWISS